MLVVFLPIFVAKTKIIPRHDFVAPLTYGSTIHEMSFFSLMLLSFCELKINGNALKRNVYEFIATLLIILRFTYKRIKTRGNEEICLM